MFAFLLHISHATGPRSPGNQSLEYLLELTKSSTPPHVRDVDPAFDCSWRKLALEYAKSLQPWLTVERMRELHDALELTTKCGLDYDRLHLTNAREDLPLRARLPSSTSNIVVVVSPTGNDNNAGSISKPLKTIDAAFKKVRTIRGGKRGTVDSSAVIQLRGGVYYVQNTLHLDAMDSYVTLTSYEHEIATISGGRLISDLTWSQTDCGTASDGLNSTGGTNAGVWCATLSDEQIG